MSSIGSSSTQSVDRQETDSILCGSYTKEVFANSRWFSGASSVDVFEVRGAKGVMMSGLDDGMINTLLKTDSNNKAQVPDLRIMFIDAVADNKDRLKVTSEVLQNMYTHYNISSRAAGLIGRQQMPDGAIQYDRESGKPTHHQFWYSVVIRSQNPANDTLNSSRRVLDWMRFCMWAGRDMITGVTTILALRCPKMLKNEFVSVFKDRGGTLVRHPMMVHAFFAQKVLFMSDQFLSVFADTIYEWEFNVDKLHSAKDFTTRSRAFLTLARQITQVTTDHEIFFASLQRLKIEHAWMAGRASEASQIASSVSKSDGPEFKNDVWDVMIADCELLMKYGKLYETRTKIGINECFAMVNQRDSEVNIKMAAESTQIARTSYQDGQSLRVIQLLTMVFLPASLCSGIFGMGFFNTSPDENGNAKFSVSSNLWWYLALTLPLTAIILFSMSGGKAYDKWRSNKRTRAIADPEQQSSSSMN